MKLAGRVGIYQLQQSPQTYNGIQTDEKEGKGRKKGREKRGRKEGRKERTRKGRRKERKERPTSLAFTSSGGREKESGFFWGQFCSRTLSPLLLWFCSSKQPVVLLTSQVFCSFLYLPISLPSPNFRTGRNRRQEPTPIAGRTGQERGDRPSSRLAARVPANLPFGPQFY